MTTKRAEKTVPEMRAAYKAFLQWSGMTGETFRYYCGGSIAEYYDGEQEGPTTPRDWLRAAEEVAYYAAQGAYDGKKLHGALLADYDRKFTAVRAKIMG